MNWTRLDWATLAIGLFIAAVTFRLFFKGFSGFREDLAETMQYGWSLERAKIFFWLLIAAGGAFSARYNLPHWFPDWFQ